jgi:hydrogenase 3 maturation protease
MLEHLREHLTGKVVVLGIGNTLRSDDGIGSILASRIKDKVTHIVYDASSSPENYLGKIIRDSPDNIIIVDAVDFGGKPGEFQEIDGEKARTTSLFSTHNASIAMAINYLQNNISADIIILMIQPKSLAFGDSLSPEAQRALGMLEGWFTTNGQKDKG